MKKKEFLKLLDSFSGAAKKLPDDVSIISASVSGVFPAEGTYIHIYALGGAPSGGIVETDERFYKDGTAEHSVMLNSIKVLWLGS